MASSFRLSDAILNSSNSMTTLKKAGPEWKFMELVDEPEINCLCGNHAEILCYLWNENTKRKIYLEPKCIEQILPKNLQNTDFEIALKTCGIYKKLLENPLEPIEKDYIQYAMDTKILTLNDGKLYQDIIHKAGEEEEKVTSLNNKILRHLMPYNSALKIFCHASNISSVARVLLEKAREDKKITPEEYYIYLNFMDLPISQLTSQQQEEKIRINTKILPHEAK